MARKAKLQQTKKQIKEGSPRVSAKAELDKAKATKERGEHKKGLKHHALNPMRLYARAKSDNFPYKSMLETAKDKHKDKFPDLVKQYNKGGRVNLRGGGLAQRGLGRAFKKGGKV
jgi:hypothetical protein